MCIYEWTRTLNECPCVYRANLSMVKELGDKAAQGRTYGNLGNAYYLLGEFEKAVAAHEKVSVPLSVTVGMLINVAEGHLIPHWTHFMT